MLEPRMEILRPANAYSWAGDLVHLYPESEFHNGKVEISLVLVLEAREAAMRGGYGPGVEGDAEAYFGVGIGVGGVSVVEGCIKGMGFRGRIQGFCWREWGRFERGK